MILLEFPMVPPTTNHAYQDKPKIRVGKRVVGGGRSLTEAGRTFKVEATNWLARHCTGELGKFRQNLPYVLHCTFFLDIYNAGYPKKTPNRYKKVDASNRIKLLEDVLCEVVGIDDSQFVAVVVQKLDIREEGMAGECCHVRIWSPEEEHHNALIC